jgi:predicted acylesterase/phospholipase RssA
MEVGSISFQQATKNADDAGKSSFKILSLDGGGVRGAFAASLLACVEEDLTKPVGEYFDLIAGTSTGGILALALAMRIPAAEIVKLYVDNGPKIFPRSIIPDRLRQLFRGKYSPRELQKALGRVFGESILGDAKNRLLIPAFDINAGKIHIFKTAHSPRFTKDHKRLVVDVAMATAAAPTYFPRHLLPNGVPLVDGGVWANNPVGLAAVEAVTTLQADPHDVKILSIGCPSAPLNLHREMPRFWGLKSYGVQLIDLFMMGQSHGSYGTAKLLIGAENIRQICPDVATGRDGMDDHRELASLIARGQAEGRDWVPQLMRDFFAAPAEEFVPLLLANR